MLPFTCLAINLSDKTLILRFFSDFEKMPVLFRRRSPMNGMDENEFMVGFREIAKTLPAPNAIVCRLD